MDEKILVFAAQDWAIQPVPAYAMSHPSAQRQHVSDAAWEAWRAKRPDSVVRREWIEHEYRKYGTVLLTVAEHDELLRAQALDAPYQAIQAKWLADVREERDQLRAELAAAKRAQMMLQAVNADLHRQLRGRDEKGRSG